MIARTHQKQDSPEFRRADEKMLGMKAGKLYASIRNDDFESLTPADFCRQLMQRHDSIFDVPDSRRADADSNDDQVVRMALSNATIIETFSTVIGNKLIQVAAAEPDTTKDWVYETSAVNFLPATLFTEEHAARLERHVKGRPAEHSSFGVKGQSWGIARYAGQFGLDEQSLLDGQHVGAVLLAAAQHGAAAARLRPDLIYSLLLANPTLESDNVALFHATHGNYATGGGSALDAASLDTAIGGIGLQKLTAQTDGYPVHSNLQAAYCIVPPQLIGPARRAVRNMTLGDDDDLEVRQESRLSALGVVDPPSGTVYSGTATNWLLTAEGNTRPTIVVGGLDGQLAPQIRRFDLSGLGRWGVGWDIVCDIGAAAIDFRGVYFAAGA